MQAQAFVRGLVEAGTCFCNESVALDTSIVEEVFAEASSRAFAETCTCALPPPVHGNIPFLIHMWCRL